MKVSLFLSVLIISSNVYSQTPTIQWQNTIGGDLGDSLYSAQQTSDGGYILGGFSRSNISGDKTEANLGAHDYWLVKIDSLGNIQWQNTIGGSDWDIMRSVIQTSDGGFLWGGLSRSNISGDKTENSIGFFDYWIVKTDGTGNILWQNTIGGSSDDWLNSIQQTADGGFILGGISNSNASGDKTENCIGNFDYWIVKTDSTGNIQWQNTIGGSFDDRLMSVDQTNDFGYILCGYSNSNISGDKTENSQGLMDYWIVKTNDMGIIQLQNTIGGNNHDLAHSIFQTSDGGFIVGGNSRSSISGDKTENAWSSAYDYWLVKIDTSANIEWQNTLGGTNNDELYSVQQTNDNGYILGGNSDSNISGDKTDICSGLNDYWVIKTDSTGNILWQNTVGGNNSDDLAKIQQTNDGGYVLGGHSQSNISGDKTENSNGSADYWIVKFGPDLSTSYNQIINVEKKLLVYPVPVTIELIIENLPVNIESITIYNSLGKKCITLSPPADGNFLHSNVSSLKPGLYIVSIKTNNGFNTGKFIKE